MDLNSWSRTKLNLYMYIFLNSIYKYKIYMFFKFESKKINT